MTVGNTLGERLENIRKDKGLNQSDISRHMGVSRSAVALWCQGATSPSIERTKELARFLEVSPEWLAFGTKGKERKIYIEKPSSEDAFGDVINEIHPQAKDDRETIAHRWALPANLTQIEMRTKPSDVDVFEIMDETLAPVLRRGDRTFVDRTRRTPSPDGMFGLWNGIAVEFKNVHFIPHSEPRMVLLSAGAPDGEESEKVELDSLEIIGRVVGVWKKV